jgi:hypothetical protein
MMSELSETKLARPMDKSNMGGDDAALAGLVAMLNNPDITGAQVPKGVDVSVPKTHNIVLASDGKSLVAEPIRQSTASMIVDDAPAAPVPARKQESTAKIFFTGGLKVGKDYLALAANSTILGFADPMYALATYFFGVKVSASEGKELPGCRELLQAIGACGRGIISAQYPMSLGRAAFVQLMRSLGTQNTPSFCPSVDWKNYGLDELLWVNATVNRAAEYAKENPAERLAITNCRFVTEYKALEAAGFQPWHVMCSGPTRASRLVKAGIDLNSPALKDVTEQLAARLDAQVTQKISQQRNGPMLHVIWNDPTPPPSPRLHTVNSFLQQLAINEIN